MKKIFLSLLLIPFAGLGRLHSMPPPSGSIVEIRSGKWPIIMQREIAQTDTTYSLQFRDAQVLSSLVMDTLSFPNSSQLKYFEKALSVLKTGKTGDIAKFKNYSITRADKKYEGVWYILKLKWSLTDFRQSEADLMINTIKGLKF
ncbi:MAG: hypothetical protein ABIR15_09440 [Chitinophagaceae bacterium]